MEVINNKLHPLVATAAVSLIVLSVAGVAAITGILPKSGASAPAFSATAPATAATVAAPGGISFSVPAAAPAPAPAAPTPKPVVKKVARPAVQARAPEPVREAEREPVREPVREYVQEQRAPVPQPQPVAQVRCLDCGTIAAVKEIAQKGEGSWIGPVAGGVGGAILGKQMGKGSGNTIMTILGAAGGAYAGSRIEEHVRTKKHWDVVVNLEDGSSRTISFPEQPGWRVGDRVRLSNGVLEAERRG